MGFWCLCLIAGYGWVDWFAFVRLYVVFGICGCYSFLDLFAFGLLFVLFDDG